MPGPRRPVLLAAVTALVALAALAAGAAPTGTGAPAVAAPPTTVPDAATVAVATVPATAPTAGTAATAPTPTSVTPATAGRGRGLARPSVLTGRVDIWTSERIAMALAAGVAGLALAGFVYGRVRSHTPRVRRAATGLAPRPE